MKYLAILILFCSTMIYAEGTQTFSAVKSADITKSYLDFNKITITAEKENEKDVLCFEIDGKYKITDTKELVLLLIEIIKDMKSKL